MLIKGLNECEEIVAGDDSILRELLHPNNEDPRFRYRLALLITYVIRQ